MNRFVLAAGTVEKSLWCGLRGGVGSCGAEDKYVIAFCEGIVQGPFSFLKRQDIGRMLSCDRFELMLTGADAVDVEGDESHDLGAF